MLARRTSAASEGNWLYDGTFHASGRLAIHPNEEARYPPGECRLAVLNRPGDLKGALKNALKDGNGISGGDHHWD
jgi:hypothetical protein